MSLVNAASPGQCSQAAVARGQALLLLLTCNHAHKTLRRQQLHTPAGPTCTPAQPCQEPCPSAPPPPTTLMAFSSELMLSPSCSSILSSASSRLALSGLRMYTWGAILMVALLHTFFSRSTFLLYSRFLAGLAGAASEPSSSSEAAEALLRFFACCLAGAGFCFLRLGAAASSSLSEAAAPSEPEADGSGAGCLLLRLGAASAFEVLGLLGEAAALGFFGLAAGWLLLGAWSRAGAWSCLAMDVRICGRREAAVSRIALKICDARGTWQRCDL